MKLRVTRGRVGLAAWALGSVFMIGMILPKPVDDPPKILPYSEQAGVPDTAINHCHYRTQDGAFLPDPKCTPGRVNPIVLTASPESTVCAGGWAGRQALATSNLDAQLRDAYGVGRHPVIIDPLIPPQLGGAVDDPYNFWPEPIEFHDMKEQTTARLWKQVCSGSMTLFEAQSRIVTNWYDAWLKAGQPNETGGI